MISERKKPQNKQELIAAITKANIRSIDVYEVEIEEDRQKLKSQIGGLPKGAKVSVILIKA